MTDSIQFTLDGVMVKKGLVFSFRPNPDVDSVNPRKGFIR